MMWIGTDTGLKRYNGYTLSDFKTSPNVPQALNNSIAEIVEAPNGDLWIGGNTLVRYDPTRNTFTEYNVSDNKRVWSIFIDQDDLVWIGGDGFGLKLLDPETGSVLQQYFTETSSSIVHSIFRHKDDRKLWVSLSDRLVEFDRKSLEQKVHPLPDGWIWDITQTRSGHIWFATSSGVYRFSPDQQTFKHYTAQPNVSGALQSMEMTSLLEDSRGELWIGSDKQGVYKYQPETDNFFHMPASSTRDNRFPPASITDIVEDDDGTIWFTAAKFGVYRISEHLEKFSTFKHDINDKNSLSFNNVLDLHEDEQGKIWIATDGGGLDRYDPKTKQFTNFSHQPDNPNSPGSNSILAIEQDINGNLWLGSWAGGLIKLDRAAMHFSNITAENSNGLAENNIFRIVRSHDGHLLISVWDRGLQVLDPENLTFESFLSQNSRTQTDITNHSINAIEPYREYQYWIGGLDGIELFDKDQREFERYSQLDVGSVNDLFQQPNGPLWIASEKGLTRFEPDSGDIRSYSTNQGLSDNSVVSIEMDHKGYLWLGTRKGLNRFDPQSESFQIFDELDGLAGNQLNRFSHLFARDGTMYFGGTDGISFFNPLKLPVNSTPPNVYLTQLRFLPQSSSGSDTSPKDINLRTKAELNLIYEQRHFSIGFVSTNFISPQKNRFKYRLQGLETDWTEIDSRQRSVRYTNLDPGSYTFEVYTANNDGIWSAQPASVAITILTPWWQSWWAMTLYVLSALLLIYGIIYLRLRHAGQQKLKLESLVADKTAQLASANNFIRALNKELEKKVEKRTQELTAEEAQRREAEAKLFYMAFHDPLTGLHNRPWLLQQLEQLISKTQHGHSGFALLFIDGDRFKRINDTHGHSVGDLLLKEAANRLANNLPANCHAVRLGGDEFTVLIDDVEHQQSVTKVPESIIQLFNQPFQLQHLTTYFRVSIGMVICNRTYTKSEEVLRDADTAMYKAKEKGRGTYQIFNVEMRDKDVEQATIESDLYHAVEKEQLFLEYQPIIDLKTSQLKSFECLLRWQHPSQGLIPPDRFIPIAEETGLIFDIGLWVIREAVRQLQCWQSLPDVDPQLTMAVNLSALQLNQPDLLEHIDNILSETQVSADKLKLEITETALMDNSENVNTLLDDLISRSIELAIDDFGTGYSSLSYLDKLPVQVLKIDRSFVDSLINRNEAHEGAQEIVKATISLAHNLNIKVVAEGIETQDQWDFLVEHNCDYGQGYFISKPLSQEKATKWVMKSVNKPKA